MFVKKGYQQIILSILLLYFCLFFVRKLSSYIISSDRPRGLDALGRTNLRTNVTIVAKKKEIFSYEYVNIVAAIEDQNFEEIRNFVGNLHRIQSFLPKTKKRLNLHITLIGDYLSEDKIQEISLWNKVKFRFGKLDRNYFQNARKRNGDWNLNWAENFCQEYIFCFVLNRSYLIKGEYQLIFMMNYVKKFGFLAADDSSIDVELYGYMRTSSVYQTMISKYPTKLRLAEKIIERNAVNISQIKNDKHIGGLYPPDHYFCDITINQDSLTSNFNRVPEFEKNNRIAIGVPTKTKISENLEDISILKTFMPSFVKSIGPEECMRFTYTVYVGFDKGDYYFDSPKNLSLIHKKIENIISEKANCITVRYISLPRSNGWLTFIWGYLFRQALQDQNYYFYQVNDDLIFDSIRWTTRFTSKLSEWNGIGVAGPNDPKWKCGLLTQAMVTRKHWDIFGYMFPLEIKDWYSDFWITRLYSPGRMFCDLKITAINMQNKGGRYRLCNRPPWTQAISRDKRKICGVLGREFKNGACSYN